MMIGNRCRETDFVEMGTVSGDGERWERRERASKKDQGTIGVCTSSPDAFIIYHKHAN